MKTPENTFDVIIIGSGMGGLTAASLLAQIADKRVLILERHFKIGGFTHTFKRDNFEWDVGLHYVGGMAPGKLNRALFDYITRKGVDWQPMPEEFEVFMYPDLTFKQRAGTENFKADLIAKFPEEEASIEQYFEDIGSMGGWFQKYFMTRALPDSMKAVTDMLVDIGSKKALMTTREYLENLTDNAHLRALLASQWGDIGMPPGSNAFAMHASLASHYLEGGFYPVGGSGMIPSSIVPIIEEKGGQALVNHRVEEILVEDGKAVGVRAMRSKGNHEFEVEYFAEDWVLSNAGTYISYSQLMPPDVELEFKEELENFTPGTTSVTLYLGLNDDPRKLGFEGENYWLFSGYDHDELYERKDELMDGKPISCYLSFPSLKNPEADGHTAEVIAFVSYEPFMKWESEPWKNRGEEYEALKKQIGVSLIGFVEERLPGFEKLIQYAELSTPLSTKHFTGHNKGTIYGMASTPERYRKHWIGPRTPVKDFYIIGSDAGSHGIIGALMSSAVTTAVLLKGARGVRELMSKAVKYSKQE